MLSVDLKDDYVLYHIDLNNITIISKFLPFFPYRSGAAGRRISRYTFIYVA